MTRFLQDVLRQPKELLKVLEALSSTSGRELIEAVTKTLQSSTHVYLTGIGASWNAALGGHAILHAGGLPVSLLDASELLLNCTIPPASSLVVVSRSGQSIEIVRLIQKARAAGATIIAITSFVEGTLAREADLTILVEVEADGGISVNTYSGLALAVAAVAAAATQSFSDEICTSLKAAIAETEYRIPGWQQQLDGTSWFLPGAPYYFLARGSSLATAYEAALLWQEGVKSPAIAMGTDSFRHGPQEVVTSNTRFAIWLDNATRNQDLAVVHDLHTLGAHVLLLGANLPSGAGDLQIEIPSTSPHWQFILGVIPIQLAVDVLARISGVNCDSFRFASYIVANDRGILPTTATTLQNS